MESDFRAIKWSGFARWRVEIGCMDKFRALLEVIGITSVRRESVPPCSMPVSTCLHFSYFFHASRIAAQAGGDFLHYGEMNPAPAFSRSFPALRLR